MKAEIIQTRFGTSLQITAMTEAVQQDLQAFMEATKRPRKPKLKILSSPDHKKYLTLGFKTYLRMQDFEHLPVLQEETKQLFAMLTPKLFPKPRLEMITPIMQITISYSSLYICTDGEGAFYACYTDNPTDSKVFYGQIFFFSDIANKVERLSRLLKANFV